MKVIVGRRIRTLTRRRARAQAQASASRGIDEGRGAFESAVTKVVCAIVVAPDKSAGRKF